MAFEKSVNPFYITGLFLYPQKTENPWVSDGFWWILRKTSDTEWVKAYATFL